MVSVNYQNFLNEVRDDLKQMIIDNYPTRKALEEADRDTIYDDAFIDDSVTGNGSGSYYFNTWKSRENVMNNEEVVEEMIDEFGVDMKEHWNDWEYLDVSCRCYLLGQIDIDKLIEEIKEENGWDETLIFTERTIKDAIRQAKDRITRDEADSVEIHFYQDGRVLAGDDLDEKERIYTYNFTAEELNENRREIIDNIAGCLNTDCEWAEIKQPEFSNDVLVDDFEEIIVKAKELSKGKSIFVEVSRQKEYATDGDLEMIDEEIPITKKCYKTALNLAQWIISENIMLDWDEIEDKARELSEKAKVTYYNQVRCGVTEEDLEWEEHTLSIKDECLETALDLAEFMFTK